MNRSSFQRGWFRGFTRGLRQEGTPEERQQLAGDVAAIQGAIPDDDYQDWTGEELRHERDRIEGALEAWDYMESRRVADKELSEQLAFGRIPEHLRGGLRRYLDEHTRAGHFLMAVLQNDLREAFGRADVKSRAGLFDLVSYLYNHAPGGAWGGKRQVEYWLTPIVPETILTTPPVVELDVDSEGKTACPQCGGRHQVHGTKAEPGRVQLPEDGHLKTAHDVQFVWCNRVHLVLVGIEGRELP